MIILQKKKNDQEGVIGLYGMVLDGIRLDGYAAPYGAKKKLIEL